MNITKFMLDIEYAMLTLAGVGLTVVGSYGLYSLATIRGGK